MRPMGQTADQAKLAPVVRAIVPPRGTQRYATERRAGITGRRFGALTDDGLYRYVCSHASGHAHSLFRHAHVASVSPACCIHCISVASVASMLLFSNLARDATGDDRIAHSLHTTKHQPTHLQMNLTTIKKKEQRSWEAGPL